MKAVIWKETRPQRCPDGYFLEALQRIFCLYFILTMGFQEPCPAGVPAVVRINKWKWDHSFS